MITKIIKWLNDRFSRAPVPQRPTPVPADEKEIIFKCKGQDNNKVTLMLHRHAIWIGQNKIELEQFTSGWKTGGVVRYRFKTAQDALHFKMVWANDESKN